VVIKNKDCNAVSTEFLNAANIISTLSGGFYYAKYNSGFVVKVWELTSGTFSPYTSADTLTIPARVPDYTVAL